MTLKNFLVKISEPLLAFSGMVAFAILTVVIINSLFGVVQISGTSMQPTYENGDMVMYKTGSKCKNGDIIIFQSTDEQYGSEKQIIKRVIGVAGDEICVENEILYVNGKEVHEGYKQGNTGDIANIIIPEGYVYVLGDNREHSKDSRSVGLISVDTIIGRAVFTDV